MPSADKDDLITDSISDEIIDIAQRLAITEGARNITVRKILAELGVTNRVFYNRFHNLEEVLEIIYINASLRMRESITSDFDIRTQFYDYVMDIAVKALIATYNIKNQFSQYMFEADSYKEDNYRWWIERITAIIAVAKETGQIRQVDSQMLSYAIWCFIRGYNNDAVNRHLSIEDAVKSFRYGFGCFLEGVKPIK